MFFFPARMRLPAGRTCLPDGLAASAISLVLAAGLLDISLTHSLDYGLGIGCRKSSHSRSSKFYFECPRSTFETLP